MADYFAAKIRIGGRISQHLIDDIANIVVLNGITTEYGGTSFASRDEAKQHILDCIGNKEVLVFQDDQARYGLFPELEDFLQINKIDYDKHSDGYTEFDANNVYQRDGRLYTFGSNQSEQDLIGIKAIQKLVCIPAVLDSDGRFDGIQTYENLRAGLKKLAPRIPDLQPLLAI